MAVFSHWHTARLRLEPSVGLCMARTIFLPITLSHSLTTLSRPTRCPFVSVTLDAYVLWGSLTTTAANTVWIMSIFKCLLCTKHCSKLCVCLCMCVYWMLYAVLFIGTYTFLFHFKSANSKMLPFFLFMHSSISFDKCIYAIKIQNSSVTAKCTIIVTWDNNFSLCLSVSLFHFILPGRGRLREPWMLSRGHMRSK